MGNKRLSINFVTCVVVFAINMGIQFFLTPYLVKHVGDSAYGYIGLANNFVSYISVLTVALNSMASRFIALEFHKKNLKKANNYFTSTFYGNLFIAIFVFVVSSIFTLNINKLLHISNNLIIDVKLTFFCVFFNFVIALSTSCFTVCTFVKNRLDISSIRNMLQNIIKVFVILILFMVFPAKIYYISLSSLIGGLVIAVLNVNLTKKLTPQLHLSLKNFRFSSLKEIIFSGIWNSINSLSSSLFCGLDLILANLMINESDMGLLSISKSIPAILSSFLGSLSGLFTPTMTMLYANKFIKELINETKKATKVYSFIILVPFIGFFIYGKDFYSLWMPSLDEESITKIYFCAVLSMIPALFDCVVFPLKALNVIVNKLKVPMVANLTGGLLSIFITYILVKYTNLGIFAIAGTSSTILVIISLVFTPIYASVILKINVLTYYPSLLRMFLVSIVLFLFFNILKSFIFIYDWKSFLLAIFVAGIIGYFISFFMIFSMSEKRALIKRIKMKLKNKMTKSDLN